MTCGFGDCQRDAEGPGMILVAGQWTCVLCRITAKLPQPEFKNRDGEKKSPRGKRDNTPDLM
jgi:hypothetical protein